MGHPHPRRVGDRRPHADHQLPRQPEGDRRAVSGDRADARARRRDAAARGWKQNPRPLSCAGSRATSASGPRCATCRVTVPAGATLAVLGRNGAGKSTLLRILATLLRPHAGEVLVFGEPLPRRAFAVRGRLGLLAHEPLLYRELTGAREPRLPRAAAPRRSGAGRGGAGRGADGAPRRRAGAPAVARDGAAAGGLPGGPARARAAAARRAAGQPRPGGQRAGRAADRPPVGPHPGADQPRPAARRWPRPTWCWRSRTAGPRSSGRPGELERSRAQGALRMRTALVRAAQGPAARAAHARDGAGDGAVRAGHVRDLPLRAQPGHDRRPARRRGADRDAAVRGHAGDQPAVRGRARAGRLRRLPARPRRPHRDAGGQGGGAVHVPGRARGGRRARRSACSCSARRSGRPCRA